MSSVRRISFEGENILRCKVGTFGNGAARNVEGGSMFSSNESRVSKLEGLPSGPTTRTSGSRTVVFENISESDSETTLRTVSESTGSEGTIYGNIPRCFGEKINTFSTRKRFAGEEATFSKRVTKFSVSRSNISDNGTRFSRKLTNQAGKFCRNWTRISKERTTDFLSGVAPTDKEDHLTQDGTRFSRHEHDQKMRFFKDAARGRSERSEIRKEEYGKDLQMAGEMTPFSGSRINAGTQVSPEGTSVCGSAGTKREGNLKESGAGAVIRGDKSVDRRCGDAPCEVYISNLDYRVGWRTLRKVFAVAGTVLHARLLTDISGKSTGSAIVRFQTPTDALRAVSVLNGQVFFGRKMFVRIGRSSGFGKQHSSPRTNFRRLPSLSTRKSSRSPSDELVSSHHTQSCIPFSPISSPPQDFLNHLTKLKPCNFASDKDNVKSGTHVWNDETQFKTTSGLCCTKALQKTVNGEATYRDIPQKCSNDLTGDAVTDKNVLENAFGKDHSHCYDDAEKENDTHDTVPKGNDTNKGTDSSNGNGSSQVLSSTAFESQTVATSADRFDLRETIHRIRRRNFTQSSPLADCEDVLEISRVECSSEEHSKKRKKTRRHSAADLLGTGDIRHSDKENTGHSMTFADRNMDKIPKLEEQLVCDSVAMLEVERHHQAAKRKFSSQDPRPKVSSTSADWGSQDSGWDGGWQEENNSPGDHQSDDCGCMGRDRLFHTTCYCDSLVHGHATQKLKTAEYTSASEAFNDPHFSTGVDNSQWPVRKGDTSQLLIPTGSSQHQIYSGNRNWHQRFFGQEGNQQSFVKQDQGHPESTQYRPDRGQSWGWRDIGAVAGSSCREEERTPLPLEQRITGTGNLLSTEEIDSHQKEDGSNFSMNAVPEILPGNEALDCCYWAPPRDALFLQGWSPQFQTGNLQHPSTTLCKIKDTLQSSSHTTDQNNTAMHESASELMPCSLKETSKAGHHNIDASVSSTTPYVMNEAEMSPQTVTVDESIQASFDAAKLEILRILPEESRPSRVIPQQAHMEKDYQSCSFPQSPRISQLQEALNTKRCNFSHNDCFTADSIPAEHDQRWFQTCEKPFSTSTTSMSAAEEIQRPEELTISYRVLEETERMARSLVDISSFQDLASQALSLLHHTPAPNAEYPHPESSNVHAARTISKALQQASAAASGLSFTLAANLELCGRQGVLEKEDLDLDTKRQLRNLPLGDPRVFVDRVLAVKGQSL